MITAHPERYQVTTSAGTVAKTIFSGGGNICYEMFVKAATSTTTFDVSLTDRFGLEVYTRDNNVGELSENIQKIAYGNWTLNITNASADEVFDILVVFRES